MNSLRTINLSCVSISREVGVYKILQGIFDFLGVGVALGEKGQLKYNQQPPQL